jgi:hypothetical protein
MPAPGFYAHALGALVVCYLCSFVSITVWNANYKEATFALGSSILILGGVLIGMICLTGFYIAWAYLNATKK